jgi:alpha-2-macroglobulin
MSRQRRLTAAVLSTLLALGATGCSRGGSQLEKELPKELLDVLPIGQKRPVEVVLASPRGELSQLDQAQSIVIGFNQPMVPLRPVSTDLNVDFVDISPKVEGRFRWKGTATLVFEPKAPLPYASRYKVTVKKGVKSWADQQLGQDFSFEFVTPTVTLTHSIPQPDVEVQGTTEPIYLHFNQPVRPQDLQSSILLSQTTEEGASHSVAVEVRAYTEEDRKQETKVAGLQDAYEVPRENGNIAGPVSHALVVTPKQPLLPGRPATLLLKPGIKSAGGPEVTTQERSFPFTTRKDFTLDSEALKNIRPEDGLSLAFTSQVVTTQVRKHLTISPAVELPEYEEEEGDGYGSYDAYLGGELKPNTTYTVSIGPELKDRFGSPYTGTREFKFTTGDYQPLLLGPEGSGLLELRGPKKIPYGIRNLSELSARFRKLTPAETIRINADRGALFSSEPYTPPGGWSKTWSLPGTRRKNETEQRDVAFEQGGLYYLQVQSGAMSQRSLVALSDIGVTAKFSPENVLIYTTTLKDARPVGNAPVELYDGKGNLKWSGQTNAEGFCQAPGWANLKMAKTDEYSAPDLWVFVRQGESQSFAHSEGYNSVGPWAFDIPYTYDQFARRFQAFAFSERGVYRPGETVQFKGSLRELREGSFKLPEVERIAYKVLDSRDREVTKGELPINRFGAFDQSLVLKGNSPTGLYRVEYRLPPALAKTLMFQEALATVTFQVEAFKPAQFEVSVTSEKPHYIMGDRVKMGVKGWYLFGAPMNERPLEWHARLEPTDLKPEGFDGFDFGLSWDSESQDEPKDLTSGNATLDEQGLASQELTLTQIPFRGSAQLVFEGSVTAPNRQRLSGRQAIPVYRGEYQLGLRSQGTFATAGKPHTVSAVAVRPGGETQQGVPLKIELVRREWNSVRKADVSGSYRWVSEVKDEVVHKQDVRTSTSPLDIQVTPPKAGYYVLRATAEDSRKNSIVSETGFYAGGSDYVAWARTEDDVVELVPDKKHYKPGDTATIMIKSPYPKTRALVTLEREHILDRWVVELEGTAPTITVPLTSRHLPNVYASVMLLQGRGDKPEFGPDGEDLAKPSFKMGYVNLAVAPQEKKLEVKIKTDKSRYAPGDEVTADFQVLDAAGKPVEAELCVAVPDQGVLALTGYKLPDWFSQFYGPRPLAVTTCETRMDVIGQRAYGSKGGGKEGGGGGFDFDSARQDFRYTAYWNPTLISGADGKAQARFKLPDNLSTFRLMAVAQTGASQFGSSESKFEVQKPLLLQPSTPDFARLHDDFMAGVVVRNNSDSKLSVRVTAEAEHLKLEGEPQQTVELAAGKEREVLFHVKAEQLRQGKLKFAAQGGSYNDALVLPVAVQQPVLLENVSTSGSSTEPTAVEMVVPSPMAAGTGVLRLFLSSSALVGLQGGLQQLLETDYVGLEPELSRIRANLSGAQLSRAMGLQAEALAMEPALADLFKYAVGEKGFAAYDSMDRVDPYLTAYALETLYLAKDAGEKVDPKLIDIARAFLKEYLNHPEDNSKGLSSAEVRVNRCMALYALSRGGFDGLSYFNNLYRNRLDLPIEARVYLLLAGRKLGAGEADLAVLEQDILNARKVEAATVYFRELQPENARWTFASDNKLSALALLALMDAKKPFADASKTVAWLMEARSKQGDWGDTHDNARVMETLQRYIETFEKEAPNFTVTAYLLKQQILKAAFSGRKLTVEQSTTPISASPERMAVGLKKDGSGRVYYEMRLSYAAAKEPPARDEGLAVLKKISNVAGDRFPADLKAGETYMVTLTVVSPRDRRFVVINDPVPAGCEVVQTQFETESAEMARILAASQAKLEAATFTHFERYSDRVALFADGLQAGEHTFQYLIRANQPGKFSLPPTKAEEIYHPEIFGTTAGRVVEIK